MATASPIPIGINLTTMGVSAAWWLESALRMESAGFRTAWAWDHYMTFAVKDRPTTPVLECWTLLAAVGARTATLRVGSFVANAVNHHPAVLTRHAMTVAAICGSGERLELGMGIGGHPAEHHAYGIDFPEPRERAARLVEQLAVVRGLLGGGPFDFRGERYALEGAYAHPVPEPRPRLVIGAEKPAGARIAARHADGMTTFAGDWDVTYPAFLEELERAGRSRADVTVIAAVESFSHPPYAEPEADLLTDLGAVAARWHERGADELIVHWVRPESLDGLLAAGERAGLRG
jgi:alkanesulfonate monooxygenase SsuD/methylene tetrahydromethanopterin reductase-like flavin-dependent oxidoreductase (luciferase family)